MKLNKPNSGVAITKSDMLRLTELHLEEVGIFDLTGLEHATNLTTLYLSWDTAVSPMQRSRYASDMSPLTTLTQLKILVLNHSNIKDVSPLANLTQLTELRLAFSNIVDVSSLANLTQLMKLDLGNRISDVSSLTGLTNLTALSLAYNNIVDVSPLANLKNLPKAGP